MAAQAFNLSTLEAKGRWSSGSSRPEWSALCISGQPESYTIETLSQKKVYGGWKAGHDGTDLSRGRQSSECEASGRYTVSFRPARNKQ